MVLKKLDDNLIEDLYVNKHMSSTKIAKELGTKSHSTILRHLIKLGIKRRGHGEDKIGKQSKLLGLKKSEQHKRNMRHPKSKEGIKNITIARIKLAKEGRIEIANRLRGKTYEEVFGKEKAEEIKEKIRKKRIGTKNPNQSILMIGDKNPAWNNGSSFEPHTKEFNKKFKKMIKERDNNICMLCGTHKEKLNRPLSIHHIDYNKRLSIEQNCVSLCISCHTKTNFNRKHWIKFFQSLLSERYEYKYSSDGESIIEINCGVEK